MDIRIVDRDQNNPPINAVNVAVLQKRNALPVVQVNPSGDYVNPGASESVSSSATYKQLNITTSATLILATNAIRISAYIQNVESQQLYIGFDSLLTVINAGIVLAPTVNNSGDGGNFSIDRYTGPIYGILASGDGDIRVVEV